MNKVIFTQVTTEEFQAFITKAIQEGIAKCANDQSVGDPEEILTRKQAANLLGLSLPTLHDYCTKGIVPAYRVGTRVRFKKSELVDCLRKVQTLKISQQ